MKFPRFQIAWMMAVVALAAINFWIFRFCYYDLWTNDAATLNKIDVMYRGCVPMANILIFGSLGLRRGSRPFLRGFEMFGGAALVIYFLLCGFHCHDLVRPYLFRFQEPLFDAIGRSHAHVPIFQFTSAVILGWWQLAFALLGGLLFHRFSDTTQPPA